MQAIHTRINIDPLALLEVKYLDMTHSKALTLGEVIALKQQGKFNKAAYTSITELMGDNSYKRPVLPDTPKFGLDLLSKLGLNWATQPKLPTPRPELTAESVIDITRTGVTINTAGQWDLDYHTLNQPAEYRPQYVNTLADNVMLRIASQVVAMNLLAESSTSEHVQYTAYRMTEIAQTHFYGNGSASGQLNRLKAVKAVSSVASAALTQQSAVDPELKFGVGNAELASYIPLNQRTRIKPPKLRDLLTGATGVDSPTLNPKSEAGPPFKPVVKRSDTLLYEALTLNRLLNDINTGPNWGGHARMKPKAEVYKVADYENKTRNIFVLNAGQSTVLSMYVNHVNALVPDQPLSGTNHSLLKRPALTTMASEYMAVFLANAEVQQATCVTYSDNMFAITWEAGVLTSTSMDGAKMEGTNTSLKMLHNFIDYTLAADEPLRELITHCASKTINSVGYLGSVALRVPGMLSGTPITTLLNSYRMGLVAANSAKLGSVTVADIVGVATKHGIQLTIERSFTLDQVHDLATNPTTLEHVGKYLDADLLGFSIGCIRVNGKSAWVAVLDHERLCKSLTFNKVENNQHYKGTMIHLIRYITMCTLYITGGWYYPGAAAIIKSACIEMVEVINEAGRRLPISLPTIVDVINNVTSELGLGMTEVQALASSMLASTIPTLETVLHIVTNGTITGEDIVADIKRLGISDQAHLLVSMQTFRDAGFTATPVQVAYYSRHTAFKPLVTEESLPTTSKMSRTPVNPQQMGRGIKRQAPVEVNKELPETTAKKARPTVAQTTVPIELDTTDEAFEPIF